MILKRTDGCCNASMPVITIASTVSHGLSVPVSYVVVSGYRITFS